MELQHLQIDVKVERGMHGALSGQIRPRGSHCSSSGGYVIRADAVAADGTLVVSLLHFGEIDMDIDKLHQASSIITAPIAPFIYDIYLTTLPTQNGVVFMVY